MADVQEDREEEKARWRKQAHERQVAVFRQSSAEEYWYPNQEESQEDGWNAGDYFAARLWRTDEITSIPPMDLTDDPSSGRTRSGLQIVSIKIASIRGGLRWPIDVFGMVVARDVLDLDRKRNIIFARARNNCQTITEEHPYLLLTGPTRAVVTCMDPGNIEIVLKVRGATESDDKDLSFLVLTLKNGGFDKDYNSKRSTLRLEFHHIYRAVEATISVRLTCGSSFPQGGFQGVFTASTANIDDAEILLLDFKDAKMPVADDGTISLSRRVVSVGCDRSDRLKVSILATQCDKETGQVTTRDDIIFTPREYGRSCGVFNVGVCKMQVTVAWSLFRW